jgi:hypothetical protein
MAKAECHTLGQMSISLALSFMALQNWGYGNHMHMAHLIKLFFTPQQLTNISRHQA